MTTKKIRLDYEGGLWSRHFRLPRAHDLRAAWQAGEPPSAYALEEYILDEYQDLLDSLEVAT